MTNPIVNLNVSVQVAPLPATLQKTGAFISQGATNTSPGTISPLTQLSSLTPLLTVAKSISSITWSGQVATVTTTSPHGFTNTDTLNLTIAGAAPSGYDGTFLCTITGASTFTYPLASNPGSETIAGTYIPADVASLLARATTFFGQGSTQSVYVLECGPGNANDGVTFLTAWITANPNYFYAFLVPRFWDGNASFLAMLASFEALTSKTYFHITTTLQNYGLYTAVMKCVVLMIEAPNYGIWPANVLTALSQTSGLATATTTTNHGVLPGQYFTLSGNTPAGYNGTFLALTGTTGETLSFNVPSTTGAESALGTLVQSQYASTGVPSTEFSLASLFFVTLNYNPSPTNKVTPLNYAFVYGVTPFPIQGNSALINTLLAAGVNLIGTGAQGGISNTLILGGTMKDGNPFKYWYSIDWAQINLQRNTIAALINGANNPQNPLDYNQPGINTLQQVSVSTMKTGIADALVLNPIQATTLDAADFAAALNGGTFDGYTVVNADPFASYSEENPNDYDNGVYNGISVDYTPLRGFESITINLNISNFAG